MNLEKIILKNLVKNEEYSRKALPFLDDSYFSDGDLLLFQQIKKFVGNYNKMPTYDTLDIEINNLSGVNSNSVQESLETIIELKSDNTPVVMDWLLDSTEKFCQEKAIYNAMTKSIEIMNNKKENGPSRGMIPQLLSDALAISFDAKIGHDYMADSEKRFEYYHSNVNRIPFDIDLLNTVTDGGVQNQTLTVFLAGPNVGKSLFLCHMAGAAMTLGKNVLYISMEMSENMVSKRIDANLLNISLKDILSVPKNLYDKKIESLKAKTTGRLFVKQYPTTGASVLHFKALLSELAIKKNFKPDIIYVDYLNICASSRFKSVVSGTNSYGYVKAVAEEIRGLAIESDLPIVTATQLNRCLDLNSMVLEKDRGLIPISSLIPGDKILSKSDIYNKVLDVFPTTKQEVYKITTETGKTIVCSGKHVFPTKGENKSIFGGLTAGDFLIVKD